MNALLIVCVSACILCASGATEYNKNDVSKLSLFARQTATPTAPSIAATPAAQVATDKAFMLNIPRIYQNVTKCTTIGKCSSIVGCPIGMAVSGGGCYSDYYSQNGPFNVINAPYGSYAWWCWYFEDTTTIYSITSYAVCVQ